MEKSELIQAIKQGFQEGKRKDEIHAALVQQGYADREIDEAIFTIQKEALKQVPGFSHFFNWFDDPKVHAKLANPRTSVFILLGIVGILAVSTVLFNYFFDPFNSRATLRDQQRAADLEHIREALTNYYTRYRIYPDALDKLRPDVIANLPTDPSTKENYAYKTEDNGFNFQLCVEFEVEHPVCIYATPIQEIKPSTKK